MGKSSIAVVLCLLVACNFLVEEVTSDCCYAYNDTCQDGIAGTPYCGYGSCNLVGCNCDGGCIKPCRSNRSLEPQAIAAYRKTDGFQNLDANGDGKVSLEEAKSIVESTGQNWEREAHIDFARMDVDLDGFLSKNEVDPVSY